VDLMTKKIDGVSAAVIFMTVILVAAVILGLDSPVIIVLLAGWTTLAVFAVATAGMRRRR
jgi:ABC-type multidrug transport system permease subunit